MNVYWRLSCWHNFFISTLLNRKQFSVIMEDLSFFEAMPVNRLVIHHTSIVEIGLYSNLEASVVLHSLYTVDCSLNTAMSAFVLTFFCPVTHVTSPHPPPPLIPFPNYSIAPETYVPLSFFLQWPPKAFMCICSTSYIRDHQAYLLFLYHLLLYNHKTLFFPLYRNERE